MKNPLPSLPVRHSFFQLNFFFLNKQVTNQAKMKCCLEELRSRQDSIENINLELEECQDQISLLEIKIKKLGSSEEDLIHERKFKRKIKQVKNKIIRLTEQLSGIKEEYEFFSSSFEKINEKEKWRGWDDFEVQCEYWDAKMRQEINHRLMLGLPIDVEILRTALALPGQTETKKQVISMMERAANKLEAKNG